MSANVETMMSVREMPWHGLGTIVQEAPTSHDAIEIAGLNWEVISNPIFDNMGREIKGYKANTRSTDESVLGIVSNKYQIVQNSEAFEFTDNLIATGDARYETAGSLRNGKQVWLLAKLDGVKVAGDDVDPYICFTNTHDGTGAIKVCMCHTRVVCNNTLNIALKEAKRSWSVKHMGDIQSKLSAAKEALGLANKYTEELCIEADKLANIKISDDEFEHIINNVFPIDITKDSARKINNINNIKDNIYSCYAMPDISNFRGTGWGIVNAVADFVDHYSPMRNTANYRENNWGRIVNGHPILDSFYNEIKKVA